MRIVIVDDYPIVRQALKGALENYDVEIVGEAGSSDEAIRLCQNLQPDLVLLDLYLPDADGLTMLKKIRKSCRTIKAVLLTNSVEAVEAQAKAAGFDAVLRKSNSPAQVGDLLASLE